MNNLFYRKYGVMERACRFSSILSVILAVMVIGGSCQANTEDTELAGTDIPVAFNSSVVTVVSSISRGTPITEADQTALQSLGVYAYFTGTNSFDPVTSTPNYMDDQLVSRTFSNNTPSDWTYSPVIYWPATGNKLTFLSYAPHSSKCSTLSLMAETGSAYPKMDFTVDSKIENQVDLLIADPVIDCERNIGIVPLKMKHALTLISFSAAVQNNTISGTMKVSKITISNVLSSGKTLTKTPVAWTDLSANTSYVLSIENGTLTDSAITTTMSLLNTVGSSLLLMPQPFNDNQAKITIEYSGANDTEKVYEESFPICYTEAAWQPGIAINYQILLNADKVEMTASITPWEKKYFFGGDKENGNLPWE